MTRSRIIGRGFWLTLVFLITFSQTVLAETLHIGSIGKSPADDVRDFLPLVQYLARSLKDGGVNEVKTIVARSMAEMAAFVRAGKVDFYIDSAFPSMVVGELTGSKLLLRRWKRGMGAYRSVIFAKKESAMSKLADLQGKIIAFEEPFSSSGYFFPKLALAQAGLKPVVKQAASDRVGANEVGYLFSNADENTMAWVVRSKVIAGATDHQTYVNQARANIKDLALLYESAPIPRHLVSWRPGLSDKLVMKVKEILLAMDKSEAGRNALAEFQQTTRFDAIPPQFSELVSKSAPFLRQELEFSK